MLLGEDESHGRNKRVSAALISVFRHSCQQGFPQQLSNGKRFKRPELELYPGRTSLLTHGAAARHSSDRHTEAEMHIVRNSNLCATWSSTGVHTVTVTGC